MTVNKTIPNMAWGVKQDDEVTNQVGCVYCLKDGIHGPISPVYYWAGTSVCFIHVEELFKAQESNPE